jgi:hypothetical protein
VLSSGLPVARAACGLGRRLPETAERVRLSPADLEILYIYQGLYAEEEVKASVLVVLLRWFAS